VIGRPAELAEGPDGSVYISDDYANAVYLAVPGGASAGVAATQVEASGDYLNQRPASALRAEAMTAGAELYAASGCVACHDFDATTADGQVPLNGLAERYGLNELETYLLRPNPPMPPFTGTDEQRRLLSIYLLEASY
jgi:mono/diheme cytochrome c family protein